MRDDLKRYRDELDRADREFTEPSDLQDVPKGSLLVGEKSKEIDLAPGNILKLKHPRRLSGQEMRRIYKTLPRHPGSFHPSWDEGPLRKTGKPVAGSQRGSTDIGRPLVLISFYLAALRLLCAIQDVRRDKAAVDDCRKAAKRLRWEAAQQWADSNGGLKNERSRDHARTPSKAKRRKQAHQRISELLCPCAETLAGATLRALEGPEFSDPILGELEERARVDLVDAIQGFLSPNYIESLTLDDGQSAYKGVKAVNQPMPLDAQLDSKRGGEKLIYGRYHCHEEGEVLMDPNRLEEGRYGALNDDAEADENDPEYYEGGEDDGE